MSLKTALGMNKMLSREKLVGCLEELLPQEQADVALLRVIKRLNELGMPLKNRGEYLTLIKSIDQADKVKYLSQSNRGQRDG